MTQHHDAICRNVRDALKQVMPDATFEMSDEEDILATGIDSIGILMLITELENRYSITLAADEIPYDQLRTISGIAAMIAARIEIPKPPVAEI